MGCLELYACTTSCYHYKIKTSFSKSHTTVWTAQYSLYYQRQKATKTNFESFIQTSDDPWGDAIHQILLSRTIPIRALSRCLNISIIHLSSLLCSTHPAPPHIHPHPLPTPHHMHYFSFLLQERAPSVLSISTRSSILPPSFFSSVSLRCHFTLSHSVPHSQKQKRPRGRKGYHHISFLEIIGCPGKTECTCFFVQMRSGGKWIY